jgi:RNA polymerase sigma factor (sigma-70 family)
LRRVPGALAARRAVDRLRQRQRLKVVSKALEALPPPYTSVGPAEQAVANELMDRIRQLLVQLPDRQADVFWLSCIEGYSHQQISLQLRVTPATVRLLLHRARSALQAALGPAYIERNRP